MFIRRTTTKAGQLMSRNPKTCGTNEPSSRAAQIMWESDCGCLPVVDVDGRTVAMITDRDICMAAFTQGKPLADIPVSSASSDHVVTVREDDAIEDVEAIMHKNRIRRVPVVDSSGRPIGILSLNDLARRAGHRRGGVELGGFVRTMAGVCEPTAREAAGE